MIKRIVSYLKRTASFLSSDKSVWSVPDGELIITYMYGRDRTRTTGFEIEAVGSKPLKSGYTGLKLICSNDPERVQEAIDRLVKIRLTYTDPSSNSIEIEGCAVLRDVKYRTICLEVFPAED